MASATKLLYITKERKQYAWEFKARNGATLKKSTKLYPSKRDAFRAAEAAIGAELADATVKDATYDPSTRRSVDYSRGPLQAVSA